MTERTCKFCGGEMAGKRPQAKYCNRTCKERARRKANNWRWFDDPPTIDELKEYPWTPIQAAVLLAIPYRSFAAFGKVGHEPWGARIPMRPTYPFPFYVKPLDDHPDLIQWRKNCGAWQIERDKILAMPGFVGSVAIAAKLIWKAGLLYRGRSNRAVYVLSEEGREYRDIDHNRLERIAGNQIDRRNLWRPQKKGSDFSSWKIIGAERKRAQERKEQEWAAYMLELNEWFDAQGV